MKKKLTLQELWASLAQDFEEQKKREEEDATRILNFLVSIARGEKPSVIPSTSDIPQHLAEHIWKLFAAYLAFCSEDQASRAVQAATILLGPPPDGLKLPTLEKANKPEVEKGQKSQHTSKGTSREVDTPEGKSQ